MEYSEERKGKGNSPNKEGSSPRWAQLLSVALIVVGFLMFLRVYVPLVRQEIRYQFSEEREKVVVLQNSEEAEKVLSKKIELIVPVDLDFSLVVPKISANSKVVADVDANNESEYQRALTRGVAHAAGTAYPGEEGNVFIFAHSGVDFAEAVRYNAVFYLLGKMEQGDEIKIFYKGDELRYNVRERKIVDADQIRYMEGEEGKKTLTLMTCWPAGTTFKRMVVIADQI